MSFWLFWPVCFLRAWRKPLRRTQSYNSDASDATEILYLSARVRQRGNGQFRLLDALAGNHGSCIHDHHLEQDICTTVHISSLPRKKNPLFTQDKILVLLTVAIADFFLIDTDEVIRIGKTLKKNHFSLFWRKETRSLLTTHLVLVSFDSQI